jgi:hypothetical protein
LITKEIIGMSEKKAQIVLEKQGYIMRVKRRDRATYILTSEYKKNRVNVVIERNKVITARIG